MITQDSKKSRRGRTPTGQPNPIDIHVGNRIKLRRTLLGLSQEKMAGLLGLTFQQIQKYERGSNRVGASRLWDISRVLEVPMGFFFEDMPIDTACQSPRMFSIPESGLTCFAEEKEDFNTDPMSRQETLELVRAYYKIQNRKTARQMLDLMVALSKSYNSPEDKL